MLKVTDQEFLEAWKIHESPNKVANALTMSIRAVYERRRRLESKTKEHLNTKHSQVGDHPKRIDMGILNGHVVVFSDAHFWPQFRTTAFKGLLHIIRELKPKAVVNNGDAFDGASISRFPRIGWDQTPSVIQELKACEMYLSEIQEASGKAKLYWPLGNHDARFENRLAANAPQYEFVKGFHLKDHFPAWHPCWSVWNGNTIIKHRYKNGIHATHNSTVNAGVNIITGHLHSLKVTPFSDYNGTRFGVDTGTLAEPTGPQFSNYLEESPSNWRSGFVVLTFHKGVLLWPEIVHAISDNCIEFRGQVIDVSAY